MAAMRNDVVLYGTTLNPNYIRPESQRKQFLRFMHKVMRILQFLLDAAKRIHFLSAMQNFVVNITTKLLIGSKGWKWMNKTRINATIW